MAKAVGWDGSETARGEDPGKAAEQDGSSRGQRPGVLGARQERGRERKLCHRHLCRDAKVEQYNLAQFRSQGTDRGGDLPRTRGALPPHISRRVSLSSRSRGMETFLCNSNGKCLFVHVFGARLWVEFVTTQGGSCGVGVGGGNHHSLGRGLSDTLQLPELCSLCCAGGMGTR